MQPVPASLRPGFLTSESARRRSSRPEGRGCAWLAFIVWATLASMTGLAGPSWAQPDGGEEAPVVAPAAPTPAAAPAPGPRTLADTLVSAGIIGVILLLLSLVAVGFMVEHMITIRKGRLMPEPVLQDLEHLVAAGQIDEALAYTQEPANDSMASRLVEAGLNRYRSSEFGFAEYKAAVEEAGEDETGRLYRKTEVLGLIGSIAPMLGLLGTVSGMINAFNKIASQSRAVRPDELAGPIGEALVTTFLGLVVAIPTMVAFSFFRNRIDSVVSEAGKRIEQILAPLSRRQT